jgi:phage terminase large subunit-like protein
MTISLPGRTETRGEKVCRFIERHLKVPEGDLIGQPMKLAEFQRRFILEVYDNPNGTSRAYLSIARKNAKTALIAAIVLAHIDGPEAFPNSQIVSGARSRDQASQIYKYASKMVAASPTLSNRIRPVPSSKKLIGLAANVEYQALSADAKTNHGLSPIVAILDEVGQVRGPYDDFVEAITTSQGAYDNALLFAISTQAASDDDLFSRWLDYARDTKDPHTVCHLYTAPEDCDMGDEKAWAAANPALGLFRSKVELERKYKVAAEMPTEENSFRWLYLNQRISADAPFVSKGVWLDNAGSPENFDGRDVYGGLDLSQRNDMSALVWIADGDTVDVEPHFWLPEQGLEFRSRREKVPLDLWAKDGHLHTSPGSSINYRHIAEEIAEACDRWNVRSIAYDPNMFEALKPHLEDLGLDTEDKALFHKVPQGYAGMSPCVGELQALLLDRKLRHGGHPVLEWNAKNAVLVRGRVSDQFMLAKPRGADHRRIDGLVALSMAAGRRAMMLEEEPQFDVAALFA